jgi:putative ABC transport system permease protein
LSRFGLLARLLVRAAWVRKDRALTALISVAVVAAIATAALTLYTDLESTLSREFRGYGANVVVAKQQGSLTAEEVSKMATVLGNKAQIVPVAYAIASGSDGSKVVIGGTDINSFRELHTWWLVKESGHPHTQVLMGARAAKALSPSGNGFSVSFGEKQVSLEPEIVFTSGSEDDSRIYLDFKQFTALTGVQPATALVRVEGRSQQVQEAIQILRASLPGVEINPVRQITQAQSAVVGKTRSTVLAASVVVMVLITLCMVATFTSSVLERRKDFAVMKALGASNKAVALLFASEAALLALGGATLGFIAGSMIAFWIGRANFDSAIPPQPMLLVPVFLGSVILALLASAAPLRLLQKIQPAGILRGE